MSDYKATLNLPATDFPMRAALSQREPQILQRWQQQDIYAAIRQAKQGCPLFILHDGPPYANGDIHVGHALNKILKDIIIKSKGLSGFDAPYIPGWDCHGLPIELKVEQQLGKRASLNNITDFQQACRHYAQQQIEQQRQAFMRLGVLGDWQHPYLTMDFATEAATLRLLATIIEHGHLTRGTKPVHWCTDCRSALAEAELEYHDKVSLSLDVRFLAEDARAVTQRFACHPTQLSIAAIIWTTTPWTLPANRALAFNAEACYQLVQVTQGTTEECLIIAADQRAELFSQWSISQWLVLGSALGADLVGLRFHHPFYHFSVPVVIGEHVTTDSGTGIVHTAPGHGPEDFIIGLQAGLEIANPVGDDGCYLPGTEELAGCSIFAAEQPILTLLQQRGTLLRQIKIQHSYPHCWRHRIPVIFRAVPQWFISMDQRDLRKQALQQIAQVTWIPEWGEARIQAMVASRPDWCISRQRTWGTPLALFLHKESGQWHPHSIELLQQIAQRVEQQGISAWWTLDPIELLGDDAIHYEKCLDILDVWFDSGATHTSVIGERSEYAGATTADLYLEGSDQHRGWFMSSLMLATAAQGSAPYRQVLTHGFTVDSQGRKMSKSLGNVISPQEIVDTLGADVLRLWVAATDYRSEITLSTSLLQGIADLYRRIRNTARFLLANLHGFDPQQHQIAHGQQILIDQWAIDRAQQLQKQLITAYEQYEFHRVVQQLMHFCSIEMGSFYLDIIKDRQYTTQTNSLARRSCQTALYHIAEALVRWIAPILSFTADEMWQYLPGQRRHSVFLETWYPSLTPMPPHPQLNDEGWNQLMSVRNAVNGALEQARAQKIIGSSLAAAITLYAQSPWAEKLLALGEELRFLLIVSQANVIVITAPPSNETMAQPCTLNGLWIHITAASGNKCQRCWHYTINRDEDNASISTPTELCQRCNSNVWGTGEIRCFV